MTEPSDTPIYDELVEEKETDNASDLAEVVDDHKSSHGPGDLSSLPESDFASFATDEVHEKEETE